MRDNEPDCYWTNDSDGRHLRGEAFAAGARFGLDETDIETNIGGKF